MAVRIQVKADTNKLLREFKSLSKSDIDKATYRAINHTLAIAQTDASKSIRSIYNFSADTVKKGMFLNHAGKNKLTGTLTASLHTIPLSEFKPKEIKDGNMLYYSGSKKAGAFHNKPTKQKTTGVSIEVIKGQRKLIKSAFLSLTNTSNGSVKAFGAYGSKGFEFNTGMSAKRLKTKSIFYAITGDRLNMIIQKRINENYVARLRQELTKGLKFAK